MYVPKFFRSIFFLLIVSCIRFHTIISPVRQIKRKITNSRNLYRDKKTIFSVSVFNWIWYIQQHTKSSNGAFLQYRKHPNYIKRLFGCWFFFFFFLQYLVSVLIQLSFSGQTMDNNFVLFSPGGLYKNREITSYL